MNFLLLLHRPVSVSCLPPTFSWVFNLTFCHDRKRKGWRKRHSRLPGVNPALKPLPEEEEEESDETCKCLFMEADECLNFSKLHCEMHWLLFFFQFFSICFSETFLYYRLNVRCSISQWNTPLTCMQILQCLHGTTLKEIVFHTMKHSQCAAYTAYNSVVFIVL